MVVNLDVQTTTCDCCHNVAPMLVSSNEIQSKYNIVNIDTTLKSDHSKNHKSQSAPAIIIGDDYISPFPSGKNLSVIFDHTLSLTPISATCKFGFPHLLRISWIRKLLSPYGTLLIHTMKFNHITSVLMEMHWLTHSVNWSTLCAVNGHVYSDLVCLLFLAQIGTRGQLLIYPCPLHGRLI